MRWRAVREKRIGNESVQLNETQSAVISEKRWKNAFISCERTDGHRHERRRRQRFRAARLLAAADKAVRRAARLDEDALLLPRQHLGGDGIGVLGVMQGKEGIGVRPAAVPRAAQREHDRRRGDHREGDAVRAVAARGDIDHVRRRGDRGENDHGFRPGAAADETHDARRHNVQSDEHHREHPDETHERRRSRVRAETAGQRQAEVIRKSDPREQHADGRRRKEAQAQTRHLRGIMLRRALRRHFKRYVLRLRVGLGEIVRPADRRRGEKPHELAPRPRRAAPPAAGYAAKALFLSAFFLRLVRLFKRRGVKVRVVLKAFVVYFVLGGLFRLRRVLIVPPVRFPGLLRLVRRGVRLGLILRLAGIKFFVFGVFRFFVRIFGLVLRLCRVIRLLGGIALRLRPVFRFRRFRRGGLLRRLVPAFLENALEREARHAEAPGNAACIAFCHSSLRLRNLCAGGRPHT